MTRKQIEKAAEATGWNVTILKRDKKYGDGYYIEFQMYTDHSGQDRNEYFWVEKLTELPHKVYDRWQEFDVDEEASIWIGPDGHGKNGAPYRITDIVKDMEEVEESLEKLYDELNKIK